jgi:hydroxymethylpyrimidine pyrophosphatase-like HAD family hydrolase
VKFSVLALDYDGTIARDGVLDPEVRKAIAELRAQEIVVLIVTGRILEELRRVAGDLHFVDAIVAENGAVIEFPASGYSAVVAKPPPPSFLEELRREGVPFEAGQVIVDTDAGEAPTVLGILRNLELPLVLVFNRGRLMVLPQTISKATGVREALKVLRLSPHNAVAIGDAENDHELLQACEVGAAVAWGSQALKSSADYVLPGNGPAAVAGYIRDLARQRLIPARLKTRRRLMLGHTDDGHPMALAVHGRNVLVAGDPKSGKSWVAGLLCEQLILYGYCLCIIDPEGDYTSLEALPGVVVFGGADPLPRPRDLLRALRHPDGSVVIDLSHTPHEEKLDYLRTLLPSLAKLRRLTGLPHRIIVDEAHYFLHDANVPELLDLELNGYTLVSYRPSKLRHDLLAASEAIVVTRESDPREVRALLALCRAREGGRSEQEFEQLFGSLVIGEAAALPVTEEAEGQMRRIRLAPRLTPHVRHFAKYIDIPVTEGRAFVFWRDGSPAGRQARTLREFVAVIEQAADAALDGHLRRRDFSHWIAEVFGDYPLANSVRRLEDEYSGGRLADVTASLSEVVRSRYEFIDPYSRCGGVLTGT